MSPREPQTDLSSWDDTRSILSVAEARARVLAAFSPLQSSETGILESVGLVLAEDVDAEADIPPFRNSAMDGYAVRSSDSISASELAPVRLTIRGEVPAGHGSTVIVESGCAVRIMTGAQVPTGSDAVVRFEDVVTDRNQRGAAASTIRLTRPANRGQNIREAGEDVARGSRVLSHGTTLNASHVGLLAALNRSTIKIIRRPIIAILATGDEVVDPGEPLQPGQIRNSSSYLLAALTRQFGGIPQLLGVARDSEMDITSKLDAGRGADLLVTSGGVSVGDYDVVKKVLRRGGEVEFWQVRIKPGKPLAFGRIGEIPLLGLPGNPVAAAVAFTQFGRPAIRRMLGLPDSPPQTRVARLDVDLDNAGRRTSYIRGIVHSDGDRLVVRPVPQQGSGVLSSLAHANCFIVVPEERERVRAGELVLVEFIDADCPF